MGPIPSINIGSAGGTSSPQPMPDTVRGAATPGAATNEGAVASSNVSSRAIAMTKVHSEVAQLLQSVGGGVENNQLLRLLIAAMILLALLTGSENEGQTENQSLSSLGARGADRSQYVGIFASSTTITIEQTSVTAVAFNGPAASGATTDTAAPQSGDQIDLSV